MNTWTIAAAARELNFSYRTLHHHVARGHVYSIKDPLSGRKKIPQWEIERLREAYAEAV